MMVGTRRATTNSMSHWSFKQKQEYKKYFFSRGFFSLMEKKLTFCNDLFARIGTRKFFRCEFSES